MAEFTLTNIIKLPQKEGTDDDKDRLWLPGTERNGTENSRQTVRMPYPVGDYDISCDACHGTGFVDCPTCNGTGVGDICPHCGGTGFEPHDNDDTSTPVNPCDPTDPRNAVVCTECHKDSRYTKKVLNQETGEYDIIYCLPCETCNGSGVVECTNCHGLGSGVMTVSPNGVIQIRYEDKVVGVNTNGLTVKVDNKTIRINEDGEGLEVITDTVAPRSGYLKAVNLVVDDNYVKPSTLTTVNSKYFVIEETGYIKPCFDTIDKIGGFVAKLTISITNPNYESGSHLIPYLVEAGDTKWNFVMDTTRASDTFVAEIDVSNKIAGGIRFKVTEGNDGVPSGYNVNYYVDVHSF